MSEARRQKLVVTLVCIAWLNVVLNYKRILKYQVSEARNAKDEVAERLKSLEAQLKEKDDLLFMLQDHYNRTAADLKNNLQTLEERFSQRLESIQSTNENAATSRGSDIVAENQSSINEIAETQDDEDTGVISLTSSEAKQEEQGQDEQSFPDTKFTTHVEEILAVVNVTLRATGGKERKDFPMAYNPVENCAWHYRIIVDQPYSPPSKILCSDRRTGLLRQCMFFRQLFQNTSRVLPFNVTVGVSNADKDWLSPRWGQCLSSSSREGQFAMNNFLDVMYQVEARSSSNEQTRNSTGYVFPQPLPPWDERSKIPVFRGQPRLREAGPLKRDPNRCPDEAGQLNGRMKVAAFSLEYPELLDAVVSPQDNAVCAQFNATNGMDQIFRWGRYGINTTGLPPAYIQQNDYYTKYQTVVVMGGIGAAFRLARHLRTGQAVVLQEFEWEEWFTPFMTPHVHYIPVKEDMSDLKEVMEWIRSQPEKVKKIAIQGQQFYNDYLNFVQNDEHWYELLWKLSILIHENGSDLLKYGSVREIWQNRTAPHIFERVSTGHFEEVVASAEVGSRNE